MQAPKPPANPIAHCQWCGKPIVKMVKQLLGRTGKYRLIWSQRLYCSDACSQRAYRVRRKRKIIERARRGNG